jgi:hypothetical protein
MTTWKRTSSSLISVFVGSRQTEDSVRGRNPVGISFRPRLTGRPVHDLAELSLTQGDAPANLPGESFAQLAIGTLSLLKTLNAPKV